MKRIISAIAIAFVTTVLYAQGPGGIGGGQGVGGPPPAQTQSIPIDGGALLLAVAGTAYGFKKYKERKQV